MSSLPDSEPRPAPAAEPPPYRLYRTRRRLFGARGGEADPLSGAAPSGPPATPTRRLPPITPRRVALGLLAIIVGWLALSLVLFLVSAQIERAKVSDAAKRALHPGGFTLTSANTILVLGSDARLPGTKEPGANVGGPSRSDTIMLLRVGGGHNARLSVPRDAVVTVPGHGTQKINAAYAFGGPALAIRTVEAYLGIEVNHLVEVNFANFPAFIDALGGIDYVARRGVLSKINGGTENGGFTLRIHRGTNHLDGKQALALARTRKNLLHPGENDLDRARRQQEIMSAVKDRLTSPGTFFRLPWVSWTAPKAIRSDMGGASLLGLFGAIATTSSPAPVVLRPSGFTTLPDGEVGLTVSPSARRAAVRRFLAG